MRMGCGVIVNDAFECWVLGTSASNGARTTFVAEILAIELGLQLGWDLGWRNILCYSDCAGVVSIL